MHEESTKTDTQHSELDAVGTLAVSSSETKRRKVEDEIWDPLAYYPRPSSVEVSNSEERG